MASVSLIIKSKTASDKTSTTTVTSVNPNASSAELYALGQKFASLMTTSDPIITRQENEVLLAPQPEAPF